MVNVPARFPHDTVSDELSWLGHGNLRGSAVSDAEETITKRLLGEAPRALQAQGAILIVIVVVIVLVFIAALVGFLTGTVPE